MSTYLSRLPIDDGIQIDYNELRRWLMELENEVGALRRRLDGMSGQPDAPGQTKIEGSDIRIASTGRAEISAAGVLQLTAASLNVSAPMSRFSGVINCDTIIATNVIGSNYTPGTGNIW